MLFQGLLTSVESFLAEKKFRSKVEAVMYVATKWSPEYVVLVSRLRQGVKLLREEGFRMYLVDKADFVDDVVNGSYAELLAHRLLLPYQALAGEELLRSLERRYKREIVLQLLRDLVAEHKFAAVNLVIQPRFFLHEKVRRMVEVFPLIRGDVAGLLEDDEMVSRSFDEVASDLVAEGLLARTDEGYSPTDEAVKRFEKSSVFAGLEQLKRLNVIKASKAFSLLVFEMASNLSSTATAIADPERFVYMRTARGLQPLSKQLDMMDFVREFFGGEASINRIGGLFNSTYLIEVDSVKLLAKRYQSWADVKWVAARIWTAWVKDFSVNPSTRLAKEIYFLDFLRNHGFNTPEVIHVNWRDKILYRSYVEGPTLIDAWLANHADKHVFAREAGETLARVHSVGVTLGDCKPESFIKAVDGRMFINDVEQASFEGNRAWDLMELIFYPGHYLDADEAASLAENIVKGYVVFGDLDVVRKSLKTSYVRAMSLWTPPWVAKAVADKVKQFLKA